MSRSFLFGGSSSIQSQNKYLVEFRAGKMSMKGKMVHPDKRKGLVFIQQTDDSLMHFCWKDRKSGLVEDDLIIFPDDVEFKKVSQCTTGRVFVLKFKSSSRKCFYWMQEPKTDKDDEYCSKVNEYLNNPPPLGSNRNGGSGLGSGSSSQSSSLQSEINNLTDNDIQNLINNMNQQQLMQLLSGVGGIGGVANLSSLLSGSRPSSSQSNVSTTESSSTPEIPVTTAPSVIVTSSSSSNSASSTTTTAPTTVTSTESSNQSQIQLSDLQNILSGLNVPASSLEGNSSHTSIDLSSALTVEALQPLFDNQELMDRLKSLLPPTSESASGLSESVAVSETLRSTVQSPQFQQALSMFSAALQSGQLGPLMQQFGLPQEVIDAANSGDMEAFVKALQKSKETKQQSDNQCNTSNTKEKKDDDEEMSLD